MNKRVIFGLIVFLSFILVSTSFASASFASFFSKITGRVTSSYNEVSCDNIIFHSDYLDEKTKTERVNFCLSNNLYFAGVTKVGDQYNWYGNCRASSDEGSWQDQVDLRNCGVSAPVSKCYDSDGGMNFDIKGKTGETAQGPYFDEDFCQNGGDTKNPSREFYASSCVGDGCYLIETSCSSTGKNSLNSYKCPNGCSNGACINTNQNTETPAENNPQNTETNPSCTDSDNGLNYSVKGSTAITYPCPAGAYCKPTIPAYDSCYGSVLTEYYCDGNSLANKQSKCANGCNKGVCLSESNNSVPNPFPVPVPTPAPTPNEKCVSGDSSCALECNDWKLDSDCGIPQIYNFVESRTPKEYLDSDMILNYWDGAWRTYQPMINKVNELTAGLTNDYDKAFAIADWVKHSRSYGGTSENGVLNIQNSPANRGESVIDIFESSSGVCLDAAVITSAMFRLAGIPSRALYVGWHSYAEGYVEGRWIGFDSTFGCLFNSDENCIGGNVIISDPVNTLSYNLEFYKRINGYTSFWSDGTPEQPKNIDIYKPNIIKRDIYTSLTAKINISWNPIQNPSEIKEIFCTISNSNTGESADLTGNSKVLDITSTDSYVLICGVIENSNPTMVVNEVRSIYFTGGSVFLAKDSNTGTLNISIHILESHNTLAGWGTLYLPHTSKRLFGKNDGTYSYDYNSSDNRAISQVVWFIMSDNWDCDFYSCDYVDSRGYSNYIAPVGFSVGEYNGYNRMALPEGRYKIVYSVPFYGDIGYYYIDVSPDTVYTIQPSQIDRNTTSDKNNLYNEFIISLEESTEGLDTASYESSLSMPIQSIKPTLQSKAKIQTICGGCLLDGSCYAYGYKLNGKFCSSTAKEFVSELSDGSACGNNFECDSNICVSSQCVNAKTWTKFINWFKGIFS